jgi:hypothetical protein
VNIPTSKEQAMIDQIAQEAKIINSSGTEFHPGDPVTWETMWTEEEQWFSEGVILDLGTDRSDTVLIMEVKRTSACGDYTKWIGEPTEVFIDMLEYLMVIV